MVRYGVWERKLGGGEGAGQVRSDCLTCTFIERCAPPVVTGTGTSLRRFLCPGQEVRGGGGGGAVEC